MNHLQVTKVINVIPPVAIVDNASWTTTEIDTKGYDYATIVINLGASDVAAAALKVQESDTSGSGFADVTGLVYGTSTDISGSTSSLPGTTNDTVWMFEVDLRNRKRYLDVVATAGNGTSGTFASGVCLLSRAKNHPQTATERGVANVLRV